MNTTPKQPSLNRGASGKQVPKDPLPHFEPPGGRSHRRAFLRTGAGVCGTLALPARLFSADPEQQRPANAPAAGTRCLDFGLSFVCNTAAFNSVRMWIESRTTIIDPQAGTRTEYYQCGSCKSENTFAERDLFKADNYDFLPIFGDGRWLIFRRHAATTPGYRQMRKQEEMWGAPVLKLREPAAITGLDAWEKVRDATAAGLPIVTQTELHNPDTGLRAIIECPTKTLNIDRNNRKYQVDTGPVALPDLTRRYDLQIESLSLAYLAFNAPGFADFVVESETPVLEGGKEAAKVFHYSKLLSLPAKNLLLALGKLS